MSKQYEVWLLKQAGGSTADNLAPNTLDWLSDTQFMKKSSIKRTYERKRPNYQVIEGVEGMCRLCLNSPEDGITIFSEGSEYSPLATRIMLCCGLEISRDSNLPNKICKNCYKQVESFYTFRKMCEIVYQNLKRHVQAVRIKENSDICNTEHANDEKTESTEIISNDIENKINVDTIDADQAINNQCIDPETIQMSSIVLVFNDSDTEIASYSQYKDHVETSNNNQDITNVNEISQPISDSTIKTFDKTNENFKKKMSASPVGIPSDKYYQTQTTNIKNEDPHEQTGKDENNVNIPSQVINKSNNNSLNQYSDSVNNYYPAVPVVLNADKKQIDMNVTNIKSPRQQAIDVSSFIKTELLATRAIHMEDSKLVVPENIDTVVELLTKECIAVTLQLEEEDDDDDEKEDSSLNEDILCKELRHNIKDKIECQRNLLESALVKKGVDSIDMNSCTVCNKLFSRRSVLRRHMRVHLDLRPYVCKTCGRSFTQKEVMKRHELVHAAQRPYACRSCPKSFTQRNGLVAHERTHMPTDSRPLTIHTCSLCPKMFLHPSGLSRHMKTHEGRLHLCGGCGRVFKDSSALRRHVKICSGIASDHRPQAMCEVEVNT